MRNELVLYCEDIIATIFKKGLEAHFKNYQYFHLESRQFGAITSSFDETLIDQLGLSAGSVLFTQNECTIRLIPSGLLMKCFQNNDIKIYAKFSYFGSGEQIIDYKNLEYFEKIEIMGMPNDIDDIKEILSELTQFHSALSLFFDF